MTSFDGQVHELENGIFQLVVTLCQLHTSAYPPAHAHGKVAQYLRKLADGLEGLHQGRQQQGETNA